VNKGHLQLLTTVLLYLAQDVMPGVITPGQDARGNIGQHHVYSFKTEEWHHLIVNSPESFESATRICEHLDMQLASIETAEENAVVSQGIRDFIADHSPGNNSVNNFWLSGEYLKDWNKWIWSSTNEDVDYNNWAEGQPWGHDDTHEYIYIGVRCSEENGCLSGQEDMAWISYASYYHFLPICEERSV